MKISRIATVILLCLTLCGCEKFGIYLDARDVDRLELIETVGFDCENGNITVTAVSGINRDGTPATVLSESSDSVTSAIKRLENRAGKKQIFFSHAENIVIGEAAAREHLGDIMDYLERTSEMRLDVSLFVLKGSLAKDALASVSGKSYTAGDILFSMKRDTAVISEGYVFSLGDAASSIAFNGDTVISAVEMLPAEGSAKENADFTLASCGYGIVKEGALTGFIGNDAAKGVNILTGKLSSDYADIDTDSGTISLKISLDSKDISPVFDGESLIGISVDAAFSAATEEVSGNFDIYGQASLKDAENGLCELEKSYILAALEALKSTGADFLSLKKKAEIKEPLKMRALGDKWDEKFPDLRFFVSVKAEIRKSYDIDIRMKTAGGNRT